MLGDNAVVATHIRPQSLGDPHRAVRLEVVFQEGDEHPGRGYAGVVQGVAQLHFAVFILVTDLQAAGLGITQVGAGAYLEILLLPGGPEQHSSCRTGISRERNSSTLYCHS